MDIYTDYANWKVENFDLLNTLIESESLIVSRLTYVIKVIDYLYEIKVNNERTLSIDEEYIFEVGFEYLHDHFITIKDLYDTVFNHNFHSLTHYEKEINFLLYVADFEAELLNAKDNIDDDMKTLVDLEEKVLNMIKKHQHIEDALFLYLDEITIKMFEKHHLKLNPVDSIFYEIAETYNLVTVDDKDVFNDFIEEKIEETHHDSSSK